MSDWIDRIKQNDAEKSEDNRLENEMRLHRASVIKAKAPAFWGELNDRVESDCEKLNLTFKDDLRRQCSFTRIGPSEFELRGSVSGSSVLRVRLNAEAQTIDQELFEGRGDRGKRRESLVLNIDRNENLILDGLRGPTGDPAVLSEALIRKVIQADR